MIRCKWSSSSLTFFSVIGRYISTSYRILLVLIRLLDKSSSWRLIPNCWDRINFSFFLRFKWLNLVGLRLTDSSLVTTSNSSNSWDWVDLILIRNSWIVVLISNVWSLSIIILLSNNNSSWLSISTDCWNRFYLIWNRLLDRMLNSWLIRLLFYCTWSLLFFLFFIWICKPKRCLILRLWLLVLHCHFLCKWRFMCRWLLILLSIWTSNLKWLRSCLHLWLCWKWFRSNIRFVFLNLLSWLIVLLNLFFKISSWKLFEFILSFCWFKNTFSFRCLFLIQLSSWRLIFNNLSSRRLLYHWFSFWWDFIISFLLWNFSSWRLFLNWFSFTWF